MSKRDLARVFFRYANGASTPNLLIGLRLENHSTHVTDLATQWDNKRAYGNRLADQLRYTRDRLVRAAQRHDEGKPQTFRLLKSSGFMAKRCDIAYSFRGHRFLVVDDDPYVDWLIRLHHEYDVATITEAQADLRRRDRSAEGRRLAENLPYDLYTLEMCDQIDAETSSRALSGDEDDADFERPFMEYHSRFGEGVLRLDPWPFRDPDIVLKYPTIEIERTPKCERELLEAHKGDELRTWKELAVEGEPAQEKEAVWLTLRPEKGAQNGGAELPQFYGSVAPALAEPNPMQAEVRGKLTGVESDGFLLLKAPTGSGKTEAVLAPALESGRRLFLILPSRALVQDQLGRLRRYLQSASQDGRRTSLIVDTGERSERTVWWNGSQLGPKARPGGYSRHLYDADVIVTTLDSFLFRFFAFGAGNKSYTFPLRIRLMREQHPPLFCFDEAHSYDTLAWQNFLSLVEALACDMGGDVVVMSATVPAQAQEQIERLGAHVVDFTQGEPLERLRRYQEQGDGRPHPATRLIYEPCAYDALVERLTDRAAEQRRPGRKVIVAVESVRGAIEVYTNLRSRAGMPEAVVLYHGRLDAADRRQRYKAIALLDANASGPGYVLVTTSAVEVGCDLDAHVLITDLCYPEQLVQRAGRCNRRALHPDATLFVVGSKLAPFTSSLSTSNREQLEEDLIRALKRQHGGEFSPAELIELIRTDLTHDYRAEVLFSLLYEYVYEADRTAKPAHDKGLVLTRSWEPSITLMELDERVDKRGTPQHEVQVPLSRCFTRRRDEEPDASAMLLREVYDDDARQMKREPLIYGGCCYLHRLVAVVQSGTYDPEVGYADPPHFLQRRGSNGYRQTVKYHAANVDGSQERDVYLWYLGKVPSDAGPGEDATGSGAEEIDESAGAGEAET